MTGSTSSTDFPSSPGAFDRSYNGAGDVFVASVGIGQDDDGCLSCPGRIAYGRRGRPSGRPRCLFVSKDRRAGLHGAAVEHEGGVVQVLTGTSVSPGVQRRPQPDAVEEVANRGRTDRALDQRLETFGERVGPALGGGEAADES